jgi:hypothetical protein
MNLGPRIAIGAGLAGGLLIAAVVSTSVAALSDNLGPRRLASGTFYCPDDDAGACIVEVRRVRPLNAAAATEAEAAGLEVAPVQERVLRRQVARAALTTFLQNNTTPLP